MSDRDNNDQAPSRQVTAGSIVISGGTGAGLLSANMLLFAEREKLFLQKRPPCRVRPIALEINRLSIRRR